MNSINFINISKSFSEKTVLDNISFRIDKGSNYCLLGRNGAGKTTLINLLLGLIKIDSGNIVIDNETNYFNIKSKKEFGVLIDDVNLIEEFDCISFLRFVGGLYNINKNELDSKIKSITDYFFDGGLTNVIIKNLSTGMKKKLGICAAVMHTPSVLVLDEPFSGLDPVSSKLLIDFLNKYQNNQRIIFLSSHNLEYIQEISTHIGVLENGKMIYDGTLDSFTKNSELTLSKALLNSLSSSYADIEQITWI